MADDRREFALKSTEWLGQNLFNPTIRVLDGSFHLPSSGRDARAEYGKVRIPNAGYFDIDAVCDHNTDLPHMLPSSDVYERAVAELGIGNDHLIVVYDAPGAMGAARVWWTFRVFGHRDVAILDGGLSKWRAEGRPTENTTTPHSDAKFNARYNPELVFSIDRLRSALAAETTQIVDNRPARRFHGLDPEPRAVLRHGHIPGSANIPFDRFFEPGSHNIWKNSRELDVLFSASGINFTQPVVATCGSGVTAAATAFAAYLLGHDQVAVYDGSWAEWGNREDTPVEETMS